MNVLIAGGCKNGKSTYAEHIAAMLSGDAKPLYYLATMVPVDDEDNERIARHRKSREGLGFKTVEQSANIAELRMFCSPNGTCLLDSTTALLANEMFPGSGRINSEAYWKVADELWLLLGWAKHMVLVSDYIYSDAQLYDSHTETYRKGLAYVDRKCAEFCDVVLEVTYGSLIFYKGKELLGGLL